MSHILFLKRWTVFTWFVFLAGCSTISPYTAKSYEQATSLKAEALMIMTKAIEPYQNHKQTIDALKLNLDKSYEYAKGLDKNIESTYQWAILRNPMQYSLGGFLKRWEEQDSLKKPYIDESTNLISIGFDKIIELESNKRKSGNN